MAYTPNSPPWTTGNPEASAAENAAVGGLATADRLNHIETGVKDTADVADAATTLVGALNPQVETLQTQVGSLQSYVNTLPDVLSAIQAALDEVTEPLVATVASAGTVLFQFSEDGEEFSFTGGSFAWFASHRHYGVFTAGGAFSIPYVAGRAIVLDISNPSAPDISFVPVSPGMTFTKDQYVIGNTFNSGTTKIVQVYGGGYYTYEPS